MNKYDYKNPEDHIFYCDKSDWYDEVNDEIDWTKSKAKIEEFWSQVREKKMAKLDYDFSKFIFPEFSGLTFWEEDEEKLFKKQGKALINDQIREGFASFGGATFQGEASFSGATFQGWAFFVYATFQGEASFSGATFEGWASFWYATFQGKASFGGATFQGEASFGGATFSGEAYFYGATFSGTANFLGAAFRSKLFFTDIYCNKEALLSFSRTEFSTDDISKFSRWDLGNVKNTRIRFEQVVFPDKVEFLDCDFRNVEFVHGDLVKAKFVNPDFRKCKHRTCFNNETFVYNKENKASKRDQRIKHLKKIGEVYRQLKRNQMEAKDWREAGDAYRSEMVINRKLQWQQFCKTGSLSRILNLLVISVHGGLSAYQQSMARPLFLLFLLWLAFAGVLFGLNVWHGIPQALESSAYALFPVSGFIRTEPYGEEMRIYIFVARFLSTVLIAFFLIATRARLKQ